MFSIISNLVPNFVLWSLFLSFLLILWATKKNKRARITGILFLISIWMVGTRPVAESIISPLENSYSAPGIESLRQQGVKHVVVLTGGGYPVKGELLSSAFPHGSMYRFAGGLELCSRLGPDCHIIFSGSAGRSQRDMATAEYMKELFLLVAPERKVSAEVLSGSTSEHPINIKPLVGKEPFALVTSAYHMPRSMRVFRKAGLEPIPYPVDFFVRGGYSWNDFLPSAEGLWETQVALREYMAILYYFVRGQ